MHIKNYLNRRCLFHRLFTFLFCTVSTVVLFGCGRIREKDILCKTGVFSWEVEYITAEEEPHLSKAMDALSCQAIYQYIPPSTPREQVLDFLHRRKAQDHDVYYLAGEPEWGIERDAKHMKEAVQTVCHWNDHAEEGAGFTGIIWDVEPYLLDSWDDNEDEHLTQFYKNCEEVYDLAHSEGLLVIVCIPNFYDSTKYKKHLEALIQTGSDAIAVMNYDKTDEAGQIADKIALTEKHQKTLINITELQKPGYHHLTEVNTYYSDGLHAVEDSWDKLRQEYPTARLGFSFHYLKPALELLEEEG